MLAETLRYLQARRARDVAFTYEVVVVDDGSKDATAATAAAFAAANGETADTVRVLKLARNRGKGGAVKRGMLCGRGELLLMVDADGATRFSDLEALEAKVAPFVGDSAVAVGSRAHLHSAEGDVKRSWFRLVLMVGFHALVRLLCGGAIKDTQCGFKLFTRDAARRLFPNQHVERWAFDVELLFLASKQRIPVFEVPVTWKEIDGSKLTPFASSVQMAKDLLRIRMMYLFGIWHVGK
eukprot:TRINITY_DN5978_c0_g1_i1.p1 TRINITY_DN5978_c0_g1~~TRINITY_DN5978_c0_g1_i1.p1  ORF type:complete len:238 (+),score=63.67 TRINITY_DN5978_c0_g1_i1:160-873(+)